MLDNARVGTNNLPKNNFNSISDISLGDNNNNNKLLNDDFERKFCLFLHFFNLKFFLISSFLFFFGLIHYIYTVYCIYIKY